MQPYKRKSDKQESERANMEKLLVILATIFIIESTRRRYEDLEEENRGKKLAKAVFGSLADFL